MVSGPTPRVLIFGSGHERPHDVSDLLQQRGLTADCLDIQHSPERRALRAADLVVCVLDPESTESDVEHVSTLLNRAQAENVAALVWGTPDSFRPPAGEWVDCLPADVSLHEVVGRLTALARCAPIVSRTEQELQRVNRLGRHLNRYFEEIDQEMRLAGRLQRDFLPRNLPVAGPLKFSQLYRPATWVSGDIFDVFLIDERRVGMFIADAMGHGTAAGLMTMFLRRALVPREGDAATGRIVPPAEVMHQLHDTLARQDFPNAQFVTAAYAIIDTESLDMRLARGGHPHPLHISAAGEIKELCSEGGLLGIAGIEPDFSELHTRLAPGEKVILYTDGLEELFLAERDEHTELAQYTKTLVDWARLDADSLVAAIGDHLDHQEGSLNPADDVTVVVAEVTADQTAT